MPCHLAEQAGLGSLFLHVAQSGPMRRAESGQAGRACDVGLTDIQFMLRGAIKEAGLLVLINQHIAARSGHAPLGDAFNVRNAPRDHQALLNLCIDAIPADQMPTLIGVGDTVTSTASADGRGWLRGGSDRGFLNLLQELGERYGTSNRVV